MFEAKRYYKKTQIRAVTGQSPRAVDAWLFRERVPRLAFSSRDIRYVGADLNAALERAVARGKTPGRPTGACAPREGGRA